MLRSIDSLSDYTMLAADGEEIGKIDAFLFDDVKWSIRYLVVKIDNWLQSRKVLIAPVALKQPDEKAETVPTDLTREQVKNSPDIDVEKPISMQKQAQLHEHYEWPGYVYPTFPSLTPRVRISESGDEAEEEQGDPHLRSTKEVIGYHFQAIDEEVGHVEDFLVDDEVWIIRYLMVDTRNWLPGRKVLIAVEWVHQIKWADSKVYVDLFKEGIKTSPEFGMNTPIDRIYENVSFG
jgi:sporulation protein YlmC with PRC-barrel domain